MSGKKQFTLAAFGFTKSIIHRGGKTAVDLPHAISDDKPKLKCRFCEQEFANQQGLSVHTLCKHADKPSSSTKSSLVSQLPDSQPWEDISSSADQSTDIQPTTTDDQSFNTDPAESNQPASISQPVERRRGQEIRKTITNSFKARAIAMVESGEKPIAVAKKFNVNRSQISKWLKKKEDITTAATTESKRNFQIRRAVKYNNLYDELRTSFLEARSKGYRIDFNWLWSKARVIYRRQQDNPDAKIKKHVIVNFIKRNHLKLRKVQRNKKVAKEEFRDSIMKWHLTLRERLVKTGKSRNDYDPVFGGFMPERRFNVDQSPLPFAIDTKKTYEEIVPKSKENRHKKVWVSQPGSGLEKRQCTLQICFRPDGEQPRIGIIFRGQGNRISEAERLSWHPNVDVFFQQNAWADKDFCLQWVKKTLKPVVKDKFVLFLDNLNAQTSEEFKEAVANLNGICWYGVPGATDIWQPVDAGYAELLKVKIKQAHYHWLDSEENSDKWYGLDEKFTASERRVLITHWVGEAYKNITDKNFDHFRYRLFQKTGCLLTADGSGDDLVQPEGLPDYKVPPPTLIEPSSNVAISSEPEVASEDNDIEFLDEDDTFLDEMEVDEGGDDGNIFNVINMASKDNNIEFSDEDDAFLDEIEVGEGDGNIFNVINDLVD